MPSCNYFEYPMKSGIWYPYNYANVDKTKCMSEITDSFNINAYTKQQCNTGNVLLIRKKVYVKVNPIKNVG